MDVGHSRLLKFLLPNNLPIMSEKQELRVEYIVEPSKVKSEVPEQQKFRQPDEAAKNGVDQENSNNDDSTFVPIFKMKKEEAVFTKGDMKLQKVSVTENISKDDLSQSKVHGETIENHQPLRESPKENVVNDDDPEMNKPRSRIPKLRLVAEKFKQDKKEERETEIPTRQPRRSSIPKLKRIKTPSSRATENISKDDTHKFNKKDKNDAQSLVANLENNDLGRPDEEFDKMFDEIIHNDNDQILDTNVLIDNVEDAEKLEHSFEEIIHDYEENRVQPIDVDQLTKRITLVKQKSLPEDNFTRKLERRTSLKDIPIHDNESEKNAVKKGSKLEDIKRKFNRNASKEGDVTITHSHSKNVGSLKPSDKNYVENLNKLETEPSKVNNDKKNIKEKETIKIATPVLKEHHIISKHETKDEKKIESDPMKAVYELKNNETIDKIHKPMKAEKENLQKNHENPEKNEDILPITASDITSGLELDKSVYIPKVPINYNNLSDKVGQSSDKNKRESDDVKNTTHIPKLREKLSQLSRNFSSEEQSSVQIPKKSPFNEIPKTCTASKSAGLNKKTNIQNKTMNDYPTPDVNQTNIITQNILTKSIINDNAKIISDEQVHKKNDSFIPPSKEREKAKIKEEEDNVNKHSDEEDLSKSYKLATKIRRDSLEKLKFVRAESVSTEIPTKLKLNIKSVTPPNTPQVYDYEPHKDNTHRVDPKILNFEVKSKQSARDIYNQVDYDRSNSIDFHSPNPDDLDRAPLFEAVNKKLNSETRNNVLDEGSVWIKGKVGRIINKIHSIDESADSNTKKGNNIEVPIEKSVSSRIAMFERPAPTPPESKPKLKLVVNNKPVIIEEVLKAQPPRDERDELKDGIDSEECYPQRKPSVDSLNTIVFENIAHVAKVVEVQDQLAYNVKEDFDNNVSFDAKSHSVGDERNKTIESDHINQENIKVEEIETTTREIYTATTDLKAEKSLPDPEKELMLSRIEERLKRIKSVNEEGKMKKSKSIAELDLGDAVKGKVHQMIVRMNSIEKIDMEKKYSHNINIRERPRKRSVSEKIALFENKFIAVDMNHATEIPISNEIEPNTEQTAQAETTTDVLSDDHRERIEGLKNAATTYGRMKDIMYIKLKNGEDMPVMALGTAMLEPILLHHIIGAAIDLGFRAIDTAYIYGNEKAIGEAIKAKIDDGTVQRKDLFIIGKLWSTFHRRELVEKACRTSLETLGLDYFDLYLVHNPMSFKEGGDALPKIANVLQYSDIDYMDAWFGMECLVGKKLAKSIGVSNFNSEQIARVVDKAKVKPVVNQVECHPYLSQQRLDQFCADRNITLMCFGTLGSKGTPKELKGNQDSVIDDPLVKVMAAALKVTTAQLLIRYQIECGRAVLTRGTSAAHLWENLRAQTFNLNTTQVNALHALNQNKRTYIFRGMGDTHCNYPFKIPF